MQQKQNKLSLTNLFSIIDILVFLLWSILFFNYWFTGQLALLIHPNYFILVFISAFIFLIIAILKIWYFYQSFNQFKINKKQDNLSILPKNWSVFLLLITAILGLLIKPNILASQAALQRGIGEVLPPTKQETQAFRTNIKPKDRNLIDWVRTFNAYPEPDAYNGQEAKISGFVVHISQLPENYLYLSRFILTCCAVDAYPVGIIVKLPESRNNYPPDSWLEVEGSMITENLPNFVSNDNSNEKNKRQLVLNPISIKPIDTPKNPYGY